MERLRESIDYFKAMRSEPPEARLPLTWRLKESFWWFLVMVPWNNRWRMTLVKALVPERIKYWSIVDVATRNEYGNPGEVTSATMLKRLEKANKRDWRGWP